jgi:hypothetical protein
MSRVAFTTLLVVAVIGCSVTMWGQEPPPNSALKREKFRNAEITYDWVTNPQGQKIRTFVTKPKSASGKVPAIFFVGWLSCDSVEYPDGETDGFGAIFWRLIEQSGFATMRMDKPGVGESQGTCAKTDFRPNWIATAWLMTPSPNILLLIRAPSLLSASATAAAPLLLVRVNIQCAAILPLLPGAARGMSTCLRTNASDLAMIKNCPPRRSTMRCGRSPIFIRSI